MKRLPVSCVVFLLRYPRSPQPRRRSPARFAIRPARVLPGVTVEAASPALIEKVRTAASDGSGQYRITDLPPGEYTLTFTLSGFNTVKRQGVTVSGTGVIPISIELAVGTLTETLTVTGESPLVDTQTTKRETVISAETIASLPITRNYGGVLYATPGLNVQPGVNANDLMPSMATFSAHGGQSTEGRVFVNGVSVNGPFGSNSVTQFAFDTSNAEEMQVLVSGGLGEAETGGPVANIVPRSGGNTFSGNAFYSGTTSKFQMNNVDDELKALGIAQAPTVRKNWDIEFRTRRTDPARSAVVLRERAQCRRRPGGGDRHGAEQVRRRRDAVGVSGRSRRRGATGRIEDRHVRPADVPAHAPQSGDVLLHLPGPVPGIRADTGWRWLPSARQRLDRRASDVRDDRTGSGQRLHGPADHADPVHLHVAGLQPSPDRRGALALRLRTDRQRLGAARLDERDDRRDGANQPVRSREQLVPRAVRLGRLRCGSVELARVVGVRHRCAQRQGGVPGIVVEVRLDQLHESEPAALHRR